jgi:hypothetical protein
MRLICHKFFFPPMHAEYSDARLDGRCAYRRRKDGATAAAEVSAAIPARAFKGMSAMIFLRRLWKISQLTTSIRPPNHHVNA